MLKQLAIKAAGAKSVLQKLSSQDKTLALRAVAKELIKDSDAILSANEKDCAMARQNGISEGMLDRLKLTKERLDSMAEGIIQVSALDDPIGDIINMTKRPNGLMIGQKRVPLGVVGMIYESRPNVTSDAFALCFKTSNAVILKGGSDAICSNMAIVSSIRGALESAGITPDAVSLIEDNSRETTLQFMQLDEYIDVLIPRGGRGLISAAVKGSTIPVIRTGTGNCHIYVDASADIDMAVEIITNAKTQRIGVCNACESLVVHKDVAEKLMPKLREAFKKTSTEVRADDYLCSLYEGAKAATLADWGEEYLDYIISAKSVSSLDEAIEHINKYNTGHSDAIITDSYENAQRFLDEIDAAAVYVNASTRFTDGFEFGFGAEIGISTQKLHVRGPMGLEALTTTKYVIYGNGQVRT